QKPGQQPAGKPATPQKPGAAPGKPAQPGKPGAQPGKPQDAAKKPVKKAAAKPKESGGGRRKIGQVLIDLGFIDEDQLWEILEEAKNTGQMTGQVAVSRGLINDDQLLAALGEQHNLKVVNLQEVKPTPEALELVQETMASVYKVL